MKTKNLYYCLFLFVLIVSLNNATSAQVTWLLGQKVPEKTPILFKPKINELVGINYSNLVLSPSGKEICFQIKDTTTDKYFIYYMQQDNEGWTNAKTAKFLGENGQGSIPKFSPCGKKFIFHRNGDIWLSNKTESGWTEGVKFDETISSANYECGLSMASNGNMYFASGGRAEGKSKQCDIYCSKLGDKKYTKAKNIESVNTSASECVVSVSPDERFLVLSRYTEHANIELFLSFCQPDGSWSQAQYLGPTFNTVNVESPLCFSADGKYFFFNRYIKTNDIPTYQVYWVSTDIFKDMLAVYEANKK